MDIRMILFGGYFYYFKKFSIEYLGYNNGIWRNGYIFF